MLDSFRSLTVLAAAPLLCLALPAPVEAQGSIFDKLIDSGTQILRDQLRRQPEDEALRQDERAPALERPPRRAQRAPPTASAPADHGLERTGVAELQELLNRFGYDAGPVDGLMGSRTAAATGSRPGSATRRAMPRCCSPTRVWRARAARQAKAQTARARRSSSDARHRRRAEAGVHRSRRLVHI